MTCYDTVQYVWESSLGIENFDLFLIACTDVHSQCETCNGEIANSDCLTCAAGYYENGGDCLGTPNIHISLIF